MARIKIEDLQERELTKDEMKLISGGIILQPEQPSIFLYERNLLVTGTNFGKIEGSGLTGSNFLKI